MEMNRSGELPTLKLCLVKVFTRVERLSALLSAVEPIDVRKLRLRKYSFLLELFSSRSARRFPLVNDPRILSAFSFAL